MAGACICMVYVMYVMMIRAVRMAVTATRLLSSSVD